MDWSRGWRAGAAVLATALIVTAVATGARAQSKVNVTGKWVLTVESAAGTSTPTATFKQDGEKLTGHYSSQTLGEADLTGTIKGQNITFSFDANAGGITLSVVYTGTLEGNDAMKGTASFGEAGDGTWTGKRQ